MRGESTETPDVIETRHLDAIQAAEFIWLHSPDGYVGLSAALEVGFARSCGVPVYSATKPKDTTVSQFVTVVPRVRDAALLSKSESPNVPTSISSFQHYYRRAAIRRGYDTEDAQQCLLLMVEEVGELARAIRKREGLTRHHADAPTEGLELADVFLYVIHMANTLGLDLASAVRAKEAINVARFLAHLQRTTASR
jgi:NTP pyrophosphatase (non-canonical NTP hydrolase)